MQIGNKKFDVNSHTYVMGILNVTPDSFSDGGRYNQIDTALFHAEQMQKEGADILDIGGESTRPNYTPVSDEEEIHRILPVIEAVKSRIDIPISVDTYKSQVAKAALLSGADLINDIWGLKFDTQMAKVIAEHQVACCLMHNKTSAEYVNFTEELLQDLQESVDLAKETGIAEEKIILDVGVGFAKSYEQNLEAIRLIEKVRMLGYPVLLGTSRKSVIGLTLDLPSSERVEGTLVTTVSAVQQGAAFVRVHDVKENVRAIQMAEALYRREDCL